MFITSGVVPGLAMWIHGILNHEDPVNKSKTILLIHPDYPPYESLC